MAGGDELERAIPIVESRLFFAVLSAPEELRHSPLAASSVVFSVDNQLVYEPFFADFGPLNMACCYRFCQQALAALEEASTGPRPRRVYFCTSDEPQRKTNAAVLVGALCVLHLSRAADDSYRPLLPLKPFAPFRDASCGPSTYHLTVLDCLRGLQRARDTKLLDFTRLPGTSVAAFDVEAYEHYERVENGDLNWAVPGKLIAFSGPHARRTRWAGFQSLTPEDYWEPFKQAGVTAIIRLNKRLYDRRRFTEGGFRHHEVYFPDGSCPTPAIVERFCAIVEAEPGVVAVHCKAGLGRTGVLIGLYIMKHHGFTANEVLGYLRIVRPGSIIGPQQHFLRDWERRMWAAGDAFRAGVTQPQRLPPPRISHGGGGAYDDGDISDEDNHVQADDDAYDDGGYTCGSPVTLAASEQQRQTQLQQQQQPYTPALVVTGASYTHQPLPSALRTSPAKPMHSGTRPSHLAISSGSTGVWGTSTGGAPSPSGVHDATRMSTKLATATSLGSSSMRIVGGSVSGDESTARRSSRAVSSLRSSAVAAFPPTPSASPQRQLSGPVHRTNSLGAMLENLPQGSIATSVPPPKPSVSASSTVRRGTEERSRSASPKVGTAGSSPSSNLWPAGASPGEHRASDGALEISTPPAMGVLRTISALTPSSGSTSSSPPSGALNSPLTQINGGSMRLVTASGQPRKLPAAAAAAYANAYIPVGSRSPPSGSSSPTGKAPSPMMAALSLNEARG